MTTPTLKGDGVELHPMIPDDAEALFRAHGDTVVHHFWAGPAHKDVEETRGYILDTLSREGAYGWTMREAGSEIVGRIALFVQREGVAEIGLILQRDAHGRGIASRTMRLVEDFGFNTLALHRIYADVDPDNAASLGLFERLGYQREGLLRGHWRTHLGIRDTVILGKLRAD
jgi:ribosomal-protein-alanine N-acetyltransferase